VNAARKALATGDIAGVLPWVKLDQESAIREAFARSRKVRTQSPDAQELADTWFFETVVRIHRAGEGAPYEGLKPAGSGTTPAIAAADKALQNGRFEPLESTLLAGIRDGLQERFRRVMELKSYNPNDTAAARKYVAAYDDFIHFAEALRQPTATSPEHAETHEH
jgi:hypothetical protein